LLRDIRPVELTHPGQAPDGHRVIFQAHGRFDACLDASQVDTGGTCDSTTHWKSGSPKLTRGVSGLLPLLSDLDDSDAPAINLLANQSVHDAQDSHEGRRHGSERAMLPPPPLDEAALHSIRVNAAT